MNDVEAPLVALSRLAPGALTMLQVNVNVSLKRAGHVAESLSLLVATAESATGVLLFVAIGEGCAIAVMGAKKPQLVVEMVRKAGSEEFPSASITMTLTSYAPGTSGTSRGVALVCSAIDAALPRGFDTRLQLYRNGVTGTALLHVVAFGSVTCTEKAVVSPMFGMAGLAARLLSAGAAAPQGAAWTTTVCGAETNPA